MKSHFLNHDQCPARIMGMPAGAVRMQTWAFAHSLRFEGSKRKETIINTHSARSNIVTVGIPEYPLAGKHTGKPEYECCTHQPESPCSFSASPRSSCRPLGSPTPHSTTIRGLSLNLPTPSIVPDLSLQQGSHRYMSPATARLHQLSLRSGMLQPCTRPPQPAEHFAEPNRRESASRRQAQLLNALMSDDVALDHRAGKGAKAGE